MNKCTLSFTARTILGITVVSLATFSLRAQNLASNTANASPSTSAVVTTPSKSTWHDTEIPEDKLISADIRDGILEVDGMVAKVHLNYGIKRVGYLYFYVPGVGTAIVTRMPMSGALKVKDAFHGSNLAFTLDGHSFALSSEADLLSEDRAEKKDKGEKEDAYVWLDTKTAVLDRNPMMGFGNTTEYPYVWPLSEAQPKDTSAHFVQPPPMPVSVLPRTTRTVSSSAMVVTNVGTAKNAGEAN